MASVISPGRARGKITSQKTIQGLSPSMDATSSSAGGIVSMNCLRRNVPNAENADGRIAAVRASRMQLVDHLPGCLGCSVLKSLVLVEPAHEEELAPN